ncbi:nucleotidyltransferase domain-containing protein [Phycisphaerales bacterium AB-hyl4]|uniref:Nucleotidyltransferase domain-containing protein n=1 Tax=Natronomicrosphaera hydrolytica TaxID=3242702 RepID=A0ABV4U5N7_9BACT
MQVSHDSSSTSSPIGRACDKFGLHLPHILAAIEETSSKQDEIVRLQSAGVGRLPDNTALVIFGSFARNEFTRSSDLDWTFLVDGPADPQHFKLANAIGHSYKQAGFTAPGATMTFGTMASSHELIHHIGLDEDTNRNFTRRMLLLLESRSVAGEVVHHRVIRGILDRYLVAERSVAWNPIERQVPRFLLNDIVRSGGRWQSTMLRRNGNRTTSGPCEMPSCGCQGSSCMPLVC